jgi:hypothetical protein
MAPFNRTFVPGWNVLDYPEGTEMYQAAGGVIFAAGYLASYSPLDQLDTQVPSGYIAPAAGAPTVTNVGADTSYTFASPAAHWFIQNNSPAAVGFELDAASTAGSPTIPPGATWSSDIPVAVLHLFTAGAQNINGTVAANIVIKGWA